MATSILTKIRAHCWKDFGTTSQPRRRYTALRTTSCGGAPNYNAPASPDVSPVDSPGAKWGEKEFRKVIERYIDFDSVPDLLDDTETGLFLSSIDVCAGTFEVFREDDLQ